MSRNFMNLIGTALIAVAGMCLGGCGESTTCGPGTKEQEGECLPGDKIIACGPGTVLFEGRCVVSSSLSSIYCGENTTWDELKQKCVGQASTGCPKCPEASGGTVCASGEVYDFTTGNKLTSANQIKVLVFDPFEYAINPKTAVAMVDPVAVDANGCFLIKDLPIPYSGFFAFVIDDSGTDDVYYPVGTTEVGKLKVNVEKAKAFAVKNSEVKAWGTALMQKEDGITEKGAYIMGFVDADGNPIEGVTPTMEGKEPPWTFNGEPRYGYLFADDNKSFLPSTATKTSKSGWVLIPNCPIVNFGGNHADHTFKDEVGGSAPEMIMFTRLKGTKK